MKKTYFRQILSTGKINELPFNSHHGQEIRWEFNEEKGLHSSKAFELVNKWNKGTSDYKYWC